MESFKNNKNMKIDYEEKTGGPTTDKNQTIQEIYLDLAKAKKQHRLEIKGIEIYFPHRPYENQINYMTKEACENKSLAALESPTGTGKTLCLLCASLGWLRAKRLQMKENSKRMSGEELTDYVSTVPSVFYSSRTHSQLSNVIKELKKTCYCPRTSVLSSRDNMCVNSAVRVSTGNQLNLKCKQVRLRKECKYFFGAEKLSLSAYDNIDIEEMYSLGQKSMFCPFYFQRNKKDIADIIFLPYNYIFESKLRKILKLNLTNSVILIDEAHNMEGVCENSKSCEISIKLIDDCLSDLKGIKMLLENKSSMLSAESVFKSMGVAKVKEQETILNSIKGYIKSFMLKQGNGWPNYGYKLTPKEFFDIFFEGSKRADRAQTLLIPTNDDSNKTIGITPENIEQHIAFLKKIETGISDELGKNSIIINYVEVLELVSILSKNYLNCVKINDTNPNNCFINNYKIFLNEVDEMNPGNNYNNSTKVNNKIRTLFIFCFNPGYGFKDIIDAKPNSVIITSGTLSPIEGVETELKCNFNIKLENKHVIDTCQVNFAILTNSIRKKVQFKFDATSRNNVDMIVELGHTISDLCKITPGGILAFFTSYQFMNTCTNTWSEHDLLSEIEKSKEIFKDMQDSNKNKIILKNFTETCANKKNKKGGILFSVCRGTSSEGIDFSDDMARMVIIVGIPYPNLGDVKVNLKKEFLDDFNNKNFQFLDRKLNIKKLTSNEWYTQAATRAVNQALGRVIRHVDDYGSIILIDNRYRELLSKKMFSAWLRESAKIYEDSKLIMETKNFFDMMKTYIVEKLRKRKENPLPALSCSINTEPTNKQNTITNLEKNKSALPGYREIQNTAKACNNVNACSNNTQNCSNIPSCNNNDYNNIINLKRSSNSNNRINDESNILNAEKTVVKTNINMARDYYKDLYNSDEDVETILNKNKNALVKKAKKDNVDPIPAEKSSVTSILETIQHELTQFATLKSSINKINNTNQFTSSAHDNFTVNTNNQTNQRSITNTSTNNTTIMNQFNNPRLNPNLTSNTNMNNSQTKFMQKSPYIFDNINTNNLTTFDTKNYNNTVNISSNNNFNILNKSKNKIEQEEENVFDNINSDELLDIINQNISIFEEDIIAMDNIVVNPNNENSNNTHIMDPNMSNVKQNRRGDREFNRSSGSKIKVVRKIPEIGEPSTLVNNLNMDNNVFSINSLTTPAKIACSPKNEIKSDALVRKLIELKDKNLLEGMLEKYNLKICFDNQDDVKPSQQKESNVVIENHKKIECPICFESEDRKFSTAKCGHVLCKQCWDKCFENKLECPICKKKVRPSTLVNIYI